MKYSIVEGPAKQEDLAHIIEGDSAFINLYVMYCDGHYYTLFSTRVESDDINYDATRCVNTSLIKPHMADLDFDKVFKDVLDQSSGSL